MIVSQVGRLAGFSGLLVAWLFAGWLFGNCPPPPAVAVAEVPLGKESPPFGPKLG